MNNIDSFRSMIVSDKIQYLSQNMFDRFNSLNHDRIEEVLLTSDGNYIFLCKNYSRL